jgi:hypothetical protein
LLQRLMAALRFDFDLILFALRRHDVRLLTGLGFGFVAAGFDPPAVLSPRTSFCAGLSWAAGVVSPPPAGAEPPPAGVIPPQANSAVTAWQRST